MASYLPESPRFEALKGEELRHSTRYEFPYVQRIAPIIDGRKPTAGEFVRVRCKDISCGGIALVMDAPPESDRFVVVLGSPPASRQVVAQVAYSKKIQVDGWNRYLVGCRFVGDSEAGKNEQ